MRPSLVSSLLLVLTGALMAAPILREAPNLGATPANQLVVSGNACGPTALLNAFRFGNSDWQRVAKSIDGNTDKEKIYRIIREVGMRPSAHFKNRPRWSRNGVNLADLCDIGNEVARGKYLPLINQEVLFRKPNETQENLLKRIHQRLETSLNKGLPPIISLRRYALRNTSGKMAWVILDAHFVTLTAIPRTLGKNEKSFAVTYIDPWGGKIRYGTIAIAERGILANDSQSSPCLEAVFPQAIVGKSLVKPGEFHALTIAATLGRW